MELHAGPPPPHCLAPTPRQRIGMCSSGSARAVPTPASPHAEREEHVFRTGIDYLTQKKTQLEARGQFRAAIRQTIQTVHQRLAAQAEQCCAIRTLSGELTGRPDEMVFNAAYLLPASAQQAWLKTIEHVSEDVGAKGLRLEASGPWPAYHFSPRLEL